MLLDKIKNRILAKCRANFGVEKSVTSDVQMTWAAHMLLQAMDASFLYTRQLTWRVIAVERDGSGEVVNNIQSSRRPGQQVS